MKHDITQQDITPARPKGSMNCSDMGPTTRNSDKLARLKNKRSDYRRRGHRHRMDMEERRGFIGLYIHPTYVRGPSRD